MATTSPSAADSGAGAAKVEYDDAGSTPAAATSAAAAAAASNNVNSGGGKKMEDKSTTKRKMKTQYQLEVLERVYAADRYPSEKVRSDLIGQLNLSDRQLQMWFCHRRLKDRKVDENPNAASASPPAAVAAPPKKQPKRPRKVAAATAAASTSSPARKVQVVEDYHGYRHGSTTTRGSNDVSSSRGTPVDDETPEQALIRHVEEQLGEPLREDGPILGNEFYPLPPGAFDSPIGASPCVTEPAGQRVMAIDSSTPASAAAAKPHYYVREHQFIPEHPSTIAATTTTYETPAAKVEPAFEAAAGGGNSLSLAYLQPDIDAEEKPPSSAEKPEKGKKRKVPDEAKALEAQGKKQKREAEKQEAARRKKEEQERKEQEKLNNKLQRERERDLERQKREQKKENERKQKQAQREQQRVEKLRMKEETRRIKEEAKMKAAYERATAKKLAKLSTGLIEDEQLELMQMGAFVEGLVAADLDGAGFDRSKVELKKFPPPSVHMKNVFGIPPWNSIQNVASFFMVWQFLMTFSDALGLWPFTIDEFVQGLHDFDSRLLNEVYISLLRTLIKDVEDAAKAAASGTAASQHTIAAAAGGHPQIVEAAYTWGFDIQEWGQHLNPLTWPEILRQFALAAGYGPKWRRRSNEEKPEVLEATDGLNAHAIATLRSGAAAVNAVALMRGKNANRIKLKKQQHPRLTPGTVKYAAFHVLSIEGGKGLTILELTDRIQKSGLRDLTSSKTPEASISAALSRDTHLFERVATSTYCVRSPFRRDAEEAEDVLQAAMEQTYLHQTRQLDPDKDEEDEEEESEAEDHEMEEQEAEHHRPPPHGGGKVILKLKQVKSENHEKEKSDSLGRDKSDSRESQERADTASTVAPAQSDWAGDPKPRSEPKQELGRKSPDDEMEINESQVGEPWVQGLIEGEYSDLSIEERLNSLVALVDVLNEGNTIRSVLDDRYDSAAALKRQLWEEFQVDKRRLREEQMKAGSKAEAQDDERQGDHPDGASAAHSDKSRIQTKAEIRLRAEKLYVIRSIPLGLDRRHNRYWQFSSANDLGFARIYFECKEDGHWEIVDTEEALDALLASLDTRGVREAGLYSTLTQLAGPVKKAMKVLSQSRALETSSSDGSPSSGVSGPSNEETPVTSIAVPIETGSTPREVEHAMERYKDLDYWMWNQCLQKSKKNFKALNMEVKRDVETLCFCETCHELYWPDEEHCPSCHTVYEYSEDTQHECSGNSKPVLHARIQLVKYLLLGVEVAIPVDAFKDYWTGSHRKEWCNDVRAATSSAELLEAFAELEKAVNDDWLASSYETTEKALASTIGVGRTKNLPWVPQTSAATALRLKALDAAIAYSTEQRQQLEDELEDNAMQQALAAQTTGAIHNERYEHSSDSGSPPAFQNGHVVSSSMRGRSRGGKGPSTRGGRHRQVASTSRVPKSRTKLSFRVGNSGGRTHEQEQQHQQQHQQQQQFHQQAKDDEEDSSDNVWDRESLETEHSYDEHQQQLREQPRYDGYDGRHQQNHQYEYQQQGEGYEQYQEQGSDEEEEESEDEQQLPEQQGAGEEYYVEEEEDEEEEDEGMEVDDQQRHMVISQQQMQEQHQQEGEVEDESDDEEDEDDDESG